MDDKKNQHKPVKPVGFFKNLIGLENDVFREKGDFKSAESSDSDPCIDSSSSSDDSNIVESECFDNDGPIDAKPKYDFEVKLITQRKFDFEVKPVTSVGPKCDLEAKPIELVRPKYDFEAKPIKSLDPKCFCLICIFKELIGFSLAYEAYEGRSILPWRFVENLSYFSSGLHKYQQEDAHEFLQCFLNRLQSRCNDVVQQVFVGRLVSKLRCCNCGHFSNTYEPLIDVSLEIKDADSLHSALDSFTRVEKLDDPKIKYTCERCKAQVSIEKKLMIDSAPSVAVFHLKRFQNDGSDVWKVDKHVSFPLELDLLPYTDNNQTNNEQMKYDLYAVIMHAGSTSSSGHYYCFICAEPNEWYKFDDTMISRVQKDVVLAEEAYVMFYAKRDTLWFSDFIALETINSSYFIELKKIMDPEQETEIMMACSMIKRRVPSPRGEELMTALCRLGSRGSSLSRKDDGSSVD
ncbi:ubiquitin carboxyl-terminal hydrolase 20-like [Capsicum annuum]|uniref:ubiquitin carboxyl-terminal hydrolase 20-like n=1 Tax=Capsicum annuum TaxID=4072 RepID=UPI001FB08946|nr:ubiquitin carboxyl-terminal hydrolase 20-like [Capsicum annuum]